MNKVNFDNLKNLKTPDSWIENALSIPNTQQKKSPILMLFSTKSSRLIAAAACLILVSAVALTIFLTQDSVTPPIDPDYIATEQTVETQNVTQAQSDSSEQTHSSGDNTQEPTNESKPNADDYQSIEPTEVVASNATQNAGGSTVNNQTNTTPNLKPIVTPIVKETTKATEKTDANHADSANKPSVKPTVSQTIKPTVKPTLAPVVEPTQKPTAKPVVKPTQKPTTPAVKPTTKPVVQPTAPPATEPTEAPTANPTSKPNNPPAMLMLPTIPPPEKFPIVDFDGPPSVTPTAPQSPPEVSPTEPTEPHYTEPSDPFGPPITATEPTMNVEGSAQDLFIKADGVVYEVQPGAVYQYTFYLTVPSVKVAAFNANTFYDTNGLELVIPTNDYGYDDLEAIFPVFGEKMFANIRGNRGALYYNYASPNGVRLWSENSIAMTINFRVTASSGVYEINTLIKELADTDLNLFVMNYEVRNDAFTTNFVLGAPSEAPTVEPTRPSEFDEYQTIDMIPLHSCPLDKVVCVGSSYWWDTSDKLHCSVYDKDLNLVGDEDYYSYRHVAVPISLENGKTEFVYDPTTYDYITDVGNYFYCFYNQYGTVYYWGRLNVY